MACAGGREGSLKGDAGLVELNHLLRHALVANVSRNKCANIFTFPTERVRSLGAGWDMGGGDEGNTERALKTEALTTQ